MLVIVKGGVRRNILVKGTAEPGRSVGDEKCSAFIVQVVIGKSKKLQSILVPRRESWGGSRDCVDRKLGEGASWASLNVRDGV
jgi:hypothetical protein